MAKLDVTQDPNPARKTTKLTRVAHGFRPNAASILYVSRESSSVPSSRPCAHHRFVSGESTKVCVSDLCSYPTELTASNRNKHVKICLPACLLKPKYMYMYCRLSCLLSALSLRCRVRYRSLLHRPISPRVERYIVRLVDAVSRARYLIISLHHSTCLGWCLSR